MKNTHPPDENVDLSEHMARKVEAIRNDPLQKIQFTASASNFPPLFRDHFMENTQPTDANAKLDAIVASGFPVIRAIEIQLSRLARTDESLRQPLEMVFYPSQADLGNLLPYRFYLHQANGQVVELFHGSYQRQDFEQLAKELNQVLVWWNQLRITLGAEGLAGELRQKVIGHCRTSHTLENANKLLQRLSLTAASAHLTVVTSEQPSLLGLNSGGQGYFITQANNINAGLSMLENDWFKQLRGNLYQRLGTLLQQRVGAAAEAILPDLTLNIDDFLLDLDRELMARISGCR